MIKYTNIVKKPKQFLALTSLTVEEFSSLLIPFKEVWETEMRYKTQSGKPRERAYKEKKNAKLPSVEDKLLFMLYYLKNNPLQASLGANFEMSQPQANKFLHYYKKFLYQTLERCSTLPFRHTDRLARYLESYEDRTFYQDGSERPVVRSTDIEVQKEYYSGKKKCHTTKNNVLIDQKAYILYLSPSYEGSYHDKKICDEQEMKLPAGSTLIQDTGFQGYKPLGDQLTIYMPVKKPRGKPWPQAVKQYNHQVSKKG